MAKLLTPLMVDDFDISKMSRLNNTKITIGDEEKFTEYIRKMTIKERKEQGLLNLKFSDSIFIRK